MTTSPPTLRRRSWRATSTAASDVDLEDRLLLRGAALVPAGVHVDGHQGLGLVEDDVAAALQPDLAAEAVLELTLDLEVLEDGRLAVVELDAALARGARSWPPGRGCARTPRVESITMRSMSSVSESRTTRSTRSGSSYRRHGAGFSFMPVSISFQISSRPRTSRTKLTLRAPAPAVRTIRPMPGRTGRRASTFFSRCALLDVLDLARDALQVGAGHHDEVAAGDAQVRGDARALGADGGLGDLDDDLGADRELLGHLAGRVALLPRPLRWTPSSASSRAASSGIMSQ